MTESDRLDWQYPLFTICWDTSDEELLTLVFVKTEGSPCVMLFKSRELAELYVEGRRHQKSDCEVQVDALNCNSELNSVLDALPQEVTHVLWDPTPAPKWLRISSVDDVREVLQGKEDISPDRLRTVANLIGKIVQGGQAYKVFPPVQVLAEPAILSSDDIVSRLVPTTWRMQFANGEEEHLSFIELLLLIGNLLRLIAERPDRPPSDILEGRPDLTINSDTQHLYYPEVAQLFVRRITLQGVVPTDVEIHYPLYAIFKDGALVKSSHPSAANSICAFRRRYAAKQLADIIDATVITLATDLRQLHDAIRRNSIDVITFDSVIVDGTIRPTGQAYAQDILDRKEE